MPAFVPNRHWSDPDHTAAVCGADVFLTRVPDVEDEGSDSEHATAVRGADVFLTRVHEDEEGEVEGGYKSPGWSMTSCRDGYVVLVNQSTKRTAVYDPLTRCLHLLRAPPVETREDAESEFVVVTPEEDPRSFRVVCISKEMRAATVFWLSVAVFSPDSREWQIFPKVGNLKQFLVYNGPIVNGTLVNGSVYWACSSGSDLHVLNTATLQLSQIDLPPVNDVWDWGPTFKVVGESSDGKPCVARLADLTLEVWVRRAAADGVDRWMLDTTFPMPDAIGTLKLQNVDERSIEVAAIISGTVYLSLDQRSYGRGDSTWLLSFCIETDELKKVCPITWSIDKSCYPYVMEWPPVLVGPKVNSGLEGA
uniref:F-box protein AT5G49610-like beta-propeller domain-containing protein n=1 Tax=Aegilops tauschii TaxID=37682 RepID=M8B9N9_AEGTA